MIAFIQKYKVFLWVLPLLILTLYLLHIYKVLNISSNQPFEVFFITGFWWVGISLLLTHFLKMEKQKRKSILLKLTGLLGVFILLLLVDQLMNIPDNPITITLLLLFWLGIGYLMSPSFFKKYKKLILFFYLAVLVVFAYYRFQTSKYEVYLEVKETILAPLFLGSIPILIILWVYEQWKWIQTLQYEKSQAELNLLKTQINPHFFFNTLNNLYSLTVRNSDKAPEVILKLSDMMRYTIYEGEKEVVPLENEIKYLQNYIDLHKMRHHKTVDIQFTTTIETKNTIAPLCFIILLENAFKHGVEKMTEASYIHIHIQSTLKGIIFSIENNFEETPKANDRGIGLKNLKHRLALIYPDAHELKIAQGNSIYKTILKIKVND